MSGTDQRTAKTQSKRVGQKICTSCSKTINVTRYIEGNDTDSTCRSLVQKAEGAATNPQVYNREDRLVGSLTESSCFILSGKNPDRFSFVSMEDCVSRVRTAHHRTVVRFFA